MLSKGPAKKVTIYVNEDTRYHLGSLYEAILTFLLHKGVAGATASRAMAGFGAQQMMHTTKIEELTEHLPIRIEFVETAEKIDNLLPTLYDMVTDGLIEVQDTQVVKVATKERGKLPKPPHEEKRGKPLYEAIVQKCRELKMAGITVFRGLEGYGNTAEMHRHHLLTRDQPILVTIVDTEENIQRLLPVAEEMMDTGLIAVSDVQIRRVQKSKESRDVQKNPDCA